MPASESAELIAASTGRIRAIYTRFACITIAAWLLSADQSSAQDAVPRTPDSMTLKAMPAPQHGWHHALSRGGLLVWYQQPRSTGRNPSDNSRNGPSEEEADEMRPPFTLLWYSDADQAWWHTANTTCIRPFSTSTMRISTSKPWLRTMRSLKPPNVRKQHGRPCEHRRVQDGRRLSQICTPSCPAGCRTICAAYGIKA